MNRIGFGPDWPGLAWAALPLVGAVVVLGLLRLGQTRPILIATIRLVTQMVLLALVLGWIVAADSPVVVIFGGLVMILVAAHSVGTRRAGRRGRWLLRTEAFASSLFSATLVMAISIRLALRVEPWYDARTVLPMLGMILGNATGAVGLAAERFDTDLIAQRDLVELRLSLGATARQAAEPALRAAVAAGLAPILNNMRLAGIVAIPGMTTGQLLAGADIGQAIRYQILLYFGNAAAISLGIVLLLACRCRGAFTPAHQLRRERPLD